MMTAVLNISILISLMMALFLLKRSYLLVRIHREPRDDKKFKWLSCAPDDNFWCFANILNMHWSVGLFANGVGYSYLHVTFGPLKQECPNDKLPYSLVIPIIGNEGSNPLFKKLYSYSNPTNDYKNDPIGFSKGLVGKKFRIKVSRQYRTTGIYKDGNFFRVFIEDIEMV